MSRTKKPTSKQALDPVAPPPVATLIGPQTTKPPAKRAKPPTVPKPGAKKKLEPIDPVKLRDALAAVLAMPDDDKPRRAYAALLSASGDPRGEFIIAGLSGQLSNPGRWTKPLRAIGKATRWRWERGFVHELRVNGYDAGCTPSNIAAVLNAEPVTELALEGCDPDQLARLLALPGIERVRRLAISGWDASDEGRYVGRIVAKAKRLTGVVELRAGIQLGDAGIVALADAETLGACVHLALGAPKASPESFAALAASPLGQRLETLEWLRDPISEPMTRLIMMMPSLQTFVASVGYVNAFANVLGARFRDRLIVDAQPGNGYLLDGIKGVSHRASPKR